MKTRSDKEIVHPQFAPTLTSDERALFRESRRKFMQGGMTEVDATRAAYGVRDVERDRFVWKWLHAGKAAEQIAAVRKKHGPDMADDLTARFRAMSKRDHSYHQFWDMDGAPALDVPVFEDGRYQAFSDMVLDSETGLWWTRHCLGEATFETTVANIQEVNATLACGGVNDWRLPTIDEMVSISDALSGGSAAFRDVTGWSWSSTPSDDDGMLLAIYVGAGSTVAPVPVPRCAVLQTRLVRS